MPSNQTAHYALNQWVKSDQVRMEDFNADNAKLDAALKAAEQRSAGLDAKIDAAAAAAEQRSAALEAAKGNCTIEFFSYVGQGRSGINNPTTITFREPPLFFFVFGGESTGVGSKHCQVVTISAGNNVFWDEGSWNGNTIFFSNSMPNWQLDIKGETYYVFAFYAFG